MPALYAVIGLPPETVAPISPAALATAPPQSAVGSSVQPSAPGGATNELMPDRLDGNPGRVPPATKSRTEPSAIPTSDIPPIPSKFDAIDTVFSDLPSPFTSVSEMAAGEPCAQTTCRTPPERSSPSCEPALLGPSTRFHKRLRELAADAAGTATARAQTMGS